MRDSAIFSPVSMNNVRHVALLITLNLTPAQLSSRAESAASGGVEVAEEDRTQEGSSRPFSETEVQDLRQAQSRFYLLITYHPDY